VTADVSAEKMSSKIVFADLVAKLFGIDKRAQVYIVEEPQEVSILADDKVSKTAPTTFLTELPARLQGSMRSEWTLQT
jgi:hypothetical protein